MDEEEPIHDGGGAGLADLDAGEIEQVPYTLARAYYLLLVRSRRTHALAPFIVSCLALVPSLLVLSVYRLSLAFLRAQAVREEEEEDVRGTIPRPGRGGRRCGTPYPELGQSKRAQSQTQRAWRQERRRDLGWGRPGAQGDRKKKRKKRVGGWGCETGTMLPRAHVQMPRLTRRERDTSG